MAAGGHRYCSLGDSRSWTDIVTNVCNLSPARVEEDFDALMGWGSLPPDLLPSFLHEATHHWCFLSPVGYVLAVLELRARRNGVLLFNAVGDKQTLQDRLLDDLSRYEMATTVLRPLAEGLALFAEFDAISGPQSSVLSAPAEMAGYFFGLRDVLHEHLIAIYETHRTPLEAMRRSYQCFRRRRALLQEPLDLSSDGYLAGYLTVRNLWLHISHSSVRLLNESDLFLMYLRSFFYDDYGLVQLLLAPAGDLVGPYAVAQHLAERFDRLAEVDEDNLRAYEAAIQAHGETTPEQRRVDDDVSAALSRSLMVEESEHSAGVQLATQLIDQTEQVDLESVEGLMALWDAEVLSSRDIMYLGSLPARVVVKPDGMCVVTTEGGASQQLAARPQANPGEDEGSIDILFSATTRIKARASAVWRGRELAALTFGGPDALTVEARTRFSRLRTSQQGVQIGTSEMNDTMGKAIRAESYLRSELDEIRGTAREVTETIYGNMSLLGVPDDRRQGVAQSLADNGLAELLDWDADTVDSLALLGLAWSMRLRRPDIEHLFSERNLQLSTALSALETASLRLGTALVIEEGDLLLSTY